MKNKIGPLTLLVLVTGISSITTSQLSAATMVNMGTAATFGLLAQTAITVAGPSTVTGDAGTASGTAMTGAGLLTLSGVDHLGDIFTQNAKLDLASAYTATAGQAPTTTYAVPTDLGATTFFPGVYKGLSSLSLTGTMTLDAQGDPNAVFIFVTGSTLVTASASTVTLLGGALPKNVFWAVGSSATLGTNSIFSGSILATTSITATTGASVEGNLYAMGGAITLDTNRVGLIPEPSAFALLGLAALMKTRRQRAC